jgi:hypothetical protein
VISVAQKQIIFTRVAMKPQNRDLMAIKPRNSDPLVAIKPQNRDFVAIEPLLWRLNPKIMAQGDSRIVFTTTSEFCRNINTSLLLWGLNPKTVTLL